MKRRIKKGIDGMGLKNKSVQTTTSILMLLYAYNLVFKTRYLTLLNPPMLWILAGAMVIFSVAKLCAIAFKKGVLGRISLVGMAMTWAMTAALYFSHPLASDGTLMSLYVMIICFITISRGAGGE